MQGRPGTASGGGLRATRRGFLRLAGATTAFTALAQLRSVPPAAADDAAGAPFFDAWQSEVLTQIAERMVDSGGEAPPLRQTGAVATIDRLCGGLDPEISGQLPLALWLFEYAPIVFDLSFSRFTRMSDAEKDASLRAWAESRLGLRRLAFMALRNLCLLGYYSQPECWPAIGYQGPLLGADTSA
jgi:hypothetical protein